MRSIRVPVVLLLSLAVPNLAYAGGPKVFAQIPPPPTGPASKPVEPDPGTPGPTENLTDEEKEERAKNLYIRAEGLSAQDNWVDAVPLYEEAYYLVPGKHGFAHKVGVAAWNAGDCDKANDYLRHFIKYGDTDKNPEKSAEAKQILGDISVSGCATQETTTTTTTTTKATEPSENENPLGESTTKTRQVEAKGAREAKKNEKKGLLLGGAVLAGVGVAGVVVGVVGLGVANGAAGSLKQLSSNRTMSGFPEGDYACRSAIANECPATLEGRMSTGNTLGYIGLGVGGAALIGGAAMLAIYMVNRKKRGNKLETTPAEGAEGIELSAFGPMLVPGGGAGAMAEIRF